MEQKNFLGICSEIQIKRYEMMEFAKSYGMTNVNTIRTSQELDQLINEYHHLKNAAIEVKNTCKQMSVIIQQPFWDMYADEWKKASS
jgi:hypothetical protein